MAHGRLELITGPMFSGKSRELILRLSTARGAGVHVLALKSYLDDRHDPNSLSSHDGLRFPCLTVRDAAEILPLVRDGAVIGIDEAQFFGIALVEVVRALVDRGLRLLVAGLNEDYRGIPFEPVPTLATMADEYIFRSALCASCGAPAVHTHRTTPSTERVLVGAREAYEARCSRCFRPPVPVS